MIHKLHRLKHSASVKRLLMPLWLAGCALFSGWAAAQPKDWHCVPAPDKASGWHCSEATTEPDASASAAKNTSLKNSKNSKNSHVATQLGANKQSGETTLPATTFSQQATTTNQNATVDHCSNKSTTAVMQPEDHSEPPAFDFATQSKLPIATSANKVDAEAGKIVFDQNVEFEQGDISLRADHATLNTQSNAIILQGNITVATPAGTIRGDSAKIDMANNQSEVINAQYTLGAKPARGDAAVIRTNAQQQLEIERGSYTQCPGDRPIWRVRAANINIDNSTHQGSAKHARLEIYNTPLIYVPYARFPVGDTRQSGVLFPALANTNEGIDITLPYYLNLAENFDATISPRYKDGHGYLTELETRWLNAFDYWEVSGAYIEDDESISQTSNPNDEQRWLISAKENGQFGDHVISSISYTKISDIDYLRDLNTTSLSVSRATHLRQQATLGYYGEDWSSGARVQQFQTIDPNIDNLDEPLKTLPEVWLRYQSAQQPFRLNTNAYARYDAFSHDYQDDVNRSYGKLQFDFPLAWRGIKATPALGVEHLDYAFDNNVHNANTPSSLSFTASEASLALAMNFEKLSGQQRKTLEPSLQYRYRELTNNASDAAQAPLLDSDWLDVNANSLWRNSRYAGYDIIEETDQLTAAISHRQLNANGKQQLAVTLGQVIYFTDMVDQNEPLQNANNNRSTRASALIGTLDANLNEHWQTLGSALWDSEQNHMREGYFALRYRNTHLDGRQAVTNLGYRFRGKNQQRSVLAESIEQADISIVTALSRSTGLIGRYQYDLRANSAIESLVGLEFDSCCVKLRLVYREGLVYNVDNPSDDEQDRSVFLQVELKGLMGIGDSLENLLKESIMGYGENTFSY